MDMLVFVDVCLLVFERWETSHFPAATKQMLGRLDFSAAISKGLFSFLFGAIIKF